MVAYEPECRVTVNVPHPNLMAGWEKIGVSIGAKHWYCKMPDGHESPCVTLAQAVNRWLNLGRHNAIIGVIVSADGKSVRAEFDGKKDWGDWK